MSDDMAGEFGLHDSSTDPTEVESVSDIDPGFADTTSSAYDTTDDAVSMYSDSDSDEGPLSTSDQVDADGYPADGASDTESEQSDYDVDYYVDQDSDGESGTQDAPQADEDSAGTSTEDDIGAAPSSDADSSDADSSEEGASEESASEADAESGSESGSSAGSESGSGADSESESDAESGAAAESGSEPGDAAAAPSESGSESTQDTESDGSAESTAGADDDAPADSGEGEPGDMTVYVDGQPYDIGEPTHDITGDGTPDTVAVEKDGTVEYYVDTDQDGVVDQIVVLDESDGSLINHEVYDADSGTWSNVTEESAQPGG